MATSEAEIEAAARAICETFYQATWEGMSEFRRDLCMKMARAALIAAAAVRAKTEVSVPREPTPSVIAAGTAAFDRDPTMWGIGNAYRAMLAAAGGNRD